MIELEYRGIKRSRNSKPIKYIVNENGCWICTSHKAKSVDGYTQINNYRYDTKFLHRVIFGIEFGAVPPELVVRHKCDNPTCINVNHMELGTQYDNIQDRVNRGRGYDMSGENNPRSKLSNKDVYEIKHLLKYTRYYYREIGSWYGVDKSQIYMIAKGKRFTHIKIGGNET